MASSRNTRPFTEKQKIALQQRQAQQTEVFGPMAAPGSEAVSVKRKAVSSQRRTERALNDFLVVYDARLIVIDHKYPLGHKERPEWLEAHRKNGVKRLREITGKNTVKP